MRESRMTLIYGAGEFTQPSHSWDRALVPSLGAAAVQRLGKAPSCRCGFCTTQHLWFTPAGRGSTEAISVDVV